MRVERTTKAAVLVSTLTVAGLVAAASSAPSVSPGGEPAQAVAAPVVQQDTALQSYLDQRAKAVEAQRASRAAERAKIEAEEERQARAEENRQARAEKNRRAAELLEAKKQRQAAQAAEAEKQRQAEAAAAAKAEKERKAAEKKRKARAERASRAASESAPKKASSSAGSGLNWNALAQCESGGRAGVVSANGMYHGLYQFSVPTWRSVGGKGLPSNASPAEQTKRAKILHKRSGPGQWPVCGKRL